MRKLICLFKNGVIFNPLWNTFWEMIIPSMQHEYKEVFNGYSKKNKRYESILECETCGHKSEAWSNSPIL